MLVVLVAVAAWIACRPQLIRAVGKRVRDGVPLRRPLAWLQTQASATGWTVPRWFAVEGVAGVALLLGLLMVAGLAAGFTALLEDVLEGDGIAVIDRPAAHWLATHRDLWLTATLRVVTQAGSPPALGVLAVVVSALAVARCRSWLPAVLGIIGAGGIALVVVTAKALVGRDRPAPPFAVISEHGYSFPSGHATGTTAVALLCAWMATRWLIRAWPWQVALWAGAFALIGAVGFCRVYLGVHYLSDVAAGWLLGLAWAAAVVLVGSWWDDTRRRRTAATDSNP